MLRAKATYAFSGNPQESQLSFPAGAILEASPDGHHAPRQGWIHGKYQHQTGWFPESYVVIIDEFPAGGRDSCPPSAPPPPPPQQQGIPTATAYAYNNEDGSDPTISVPPLSASAPPAVMAMPVPTTANNNNTNSYSAPRKELREDQLSQLISQGYTRGKYMISGRHYLLFIGIFGNWRYPFWVANMFLLAFHLKFLRTCQVLERYPRNIFETVRQLKCLDYLDS